MTNVALPIWFLTLLVATPSLCLLGLVIRMVKRGRPKRDAGSDGTIAHTGYNTRVDPSFQHDLHALQIDAVFNALVALIETERIKLKSLLCPAQYRLPEFEVEDQQTADLLTSPIEKQEKGVGHQIVERNAQGESAGDIAKELGISLSEVALAISMNQEIPDDGKCRLEAVA